MNLSKFINLSLRFTLINTMISLITFRFEIEIWIFQTTQYD